MNNEKAFPNPHLRDDSGITIRDYFAARAMEALIDNDALFSEIPTQAYALADAMMKAREAENVNKEKNGFAEEKNT